MKIAIVLGTRPEIIKMSSIVKVMEDKGADFFILHTGQHYSRCMDGVFFKQLKLPRPKYNLGVGSGTHAEETGRMLVGIEEILRKESPDIVLVEGDTNSVLAGALAASKLGIRVGHIEAGLRSYDRSMPEEINRVVADHVSDYLFAPTPKAMQNLLGEGIDKKKITITGNTIVDAVYRYLTTGGEVDIGSRLNLKPRQYFLVTLHRQENTDSAKRLRSILEGLGEASRAFNLPIIYPAHPRAQKKMDSLKMRLNGLRVIKSLGFFSFLRLESNARLILTDSGGVQEEACIIGVPCVTLRDNTERPETVEAGANIVAGTKARNILKSIEVMLRRETGWANPFGDGKAAERIFRIIMGLR